MDEFKVEGGGGDRVLVGTNADDTKKINLSLSSFSHQIPGVSRQINQCIIKLQKKCVIH